MRYKAIIGILLLIACYNMTAKEYPSNILNKQFNVQCLALDTIYNHFYDQDYGVSLIQSKELEKWVESKNDSQLKLLFELYRYKLDFIKEKTDDSYGKNVAEFIKDAGENNHNYIKAEGLELLADYCWKTKNFAAALENYIYAYECYSRFTIGEFPHKAEYIYSLGGKYYHFRDFKTAKNYFLDVWKNIPNDKIDNIVSKLNTLALCYSFLEENDSSSYYFQKALDYAVKKNDEVWIGIINGNLGTIKIKQGQFEQAIPLIEKNIISSRKYKVMDDLAISLSSLGALMLMKNEYKRDLELQLEALDIVKMKNMYRRYSVVARIYPNVAKAYAANGNIPLAYAYSDSTINVKDSLEKERNIVFLSGVQHKIDFEKHNSELQKKEAEVKQQKLYRNSVFGGFAIVLLFALIVFKQRNKIRRGKKQSDELLLNILPAEVAEELKLKGSADAKQFDNVTVLFTDFKSFTTMSEELTPQELVDELHSCFMVFDAIMNKYGIEKIKTIGDAYLAVSGLPIGDEKHAEKVVNAALEIRDFIEARRKKLGEKTFEIRIGINSGSVVAGIVGVRKFAYDIWGDTVNTAARMEQNSEAGRINISQDTYELVRDKFSCEYRGEIDAKNKGKLKMYFVSK